MNKKKRFIKTLLFLLFLIFIGIGAYIVIKQKPSGNVEYRKKPDPKKCVHPDGIDLSHHNVAYDWKKVDAKFVYVRATFGVSIKDKRYDIHRKAANRHRIPVGAYHFLIANASAKEQFKHFSSVVKRNHLSLRPMLDVEESDYWDAPKGFTDKDAHDLIRDWCDLCEKEFGVVPIIYTTETLYRRYAMHKDFDDCIWWVADYNNDADFDKKCQIPFTIHQYSDKNYVEGFYGCIDCNRFAVGKSVKDIMI